MQTVCPRHPSKPQDKPVTQPDPKLPKSDARIGGMVAAVVLVLLAVFVVVFVWMGM